MQLEVGLKDCEKRVGVSTPQGDNMQKSISMGAIVYGNAPTEDNLNRLISEFGQDVDGALIEMEWRDIVERCLSRLSTKESMKFLEMVANAYERKRQK